MSKQVTALLVVHNELASALQALKAIQNQTVQPTRIVVVDSSKIKLDLPLASKTVSPKAKLGEIISVGLADLEPASDHWFWLVHDDSEPKTNALAELLAATENSEAIVQLGPLQLSADRTRQISQFGITLSRFGEIINPLKGQLDQGQHDSVIDLFAIGTSGMLVRTDAYAEVGGLNDSTVALASDLDLSIRFRRHGYRVVGVPRAKVVHKFLTLSGKRGRGWLKGSQKTALRRATIQTRLIHDPLALALLYWLALPVMTIYRMFWRLAQKRPGYLGAELRAGIWGFVTIVHSLLQRKNLGGTSIRHLNGLRASWSDVSKHNRQAAEADESAHSLAVFERGEHEIAVSEKAKNFAQSGGFLVGLLLLVLSWNQFPIGSAVHGASAVELSNNWLTIFARAGASWQPIGQGFSAPSDPFNWVLLALSSLTFWAPNLALAILLWSARSLAFISSWKAFSLLTSKAWQRNLAAIVYSLLPALTSSINSGEYAAVIVAVVSPWLVYSIARAAGLGRSGSARSDSRTWSWVGLSGVLLATIGACSPALIVLSLLGLGLVAFTKIRRFGYLFWIPLPVAAIYLPLVMYQTLNLKQPLALLAEPTQGVQLQRTALEALGTVTNWTNFALVALVAIALTALLIKRWVVSLALVGFALIAFAASSFVQSLRFPENTFSSGAAISSVIGLTVLALVVHLLSSLKLKPILATLAVSLVLISSPLAWQALTSKPSTQFSDGTVVPLLLQKQAEQGTDLQLLVINQQAHAFDVRWEPISGTHLEDANLAYRFAGKSTVSGENYRVIAQTVGNLISGNGAADLGTLKDNKIGYVLVPQNSKNSALVASLESSELLESAGLTPFGELWRVKDVSAANLPATEHSPWSITKVVQLATLLGFALLAIPTRGKIKRPEDSVIFIDQSESELDV